jgi:hypothetical protein
MIRALTGRVEDVLTPRVREALPTRTGPTHLSELGLSTTPKSPRDSYRSKTETSAASSPTQPTPINPRNWSKFTCRNLIRFQLPLTVLTFWTASPLFSRRVLARLGLVRESAGPAGPPHERHGQVGLA